MFDGGMSVPAVSIILAFGSMLAAIALLFLRLEDGTSRAADLTQSATVRPPPR
jgi:hypothetical protein